MKIARNELKYNETTDEIYLSKGDNVLLECDRCEMFLKFKIFFGHSFYLKVSRVKSV